MKLALIYPSVDQPQLDRTSHLSDSTMKPSVARLIEQFKRAAIVTVFGYEDEDDALQRAGIESAKRTISTLDSIGLEGRSALFPLLDDPNWSIRVFAAGYLLRLAPERALPVLQNVKVRCPTEARWAACRFLSNYQDGEAPP